MKKTKFLTIVMCFLVAITSFGFVACDSSNDSKHNFDSAWAHNATDHWHVCTDEDCDEVSGKAKHNFVDGACSVCKTKDPSTLTSADLMLNLGQSFSQLNKSEGFTLTVEGKQATVCVSLPTEEETVSAKITADVDLELYVGKNSKGDLVVNGAAKFAVDANKDTTEANDLFTMSGEAYVILKNKTVYVQAKAGGKAQDESFADMEGGVDFSKSMTLAEIEELLESLISGENIFFETEESEIDFAPSFMSVIVKEVLPSVLEELSEALTPVLVNLYEKNNAALAGFVDWYVNNNFSVTETEDGYTIKFDSEKIKQQTVDTINLSIAEFIDKYYGKDTVEKWSTAFINSLDVKVSDAIASIETYLGVTVDDIAKEINKIIAIALENENVAAMLPEGTTASDYTIENLLGLEEGMTVRTAVLGMVGDMTVCDLVLMASNAIDEPETPYTKANLIYTINVCVNYAKKTTYMELMGDLANEIFGTKIDFGTMKNSILEAANTMYDILDKTFDFELKLDKDGALSSVSAKLALNTDTISAAAKENSYLAVLTTMMNGVYADVKINVSVTKGGFKNALGIDYNKIITNIAQSEANA